MIIKSGTLVLVTDGRKMMLLRNDGSASAPTLAMLTEEEADNPSTHEQGADRPGRTFSSMGSRRSSYADTDWQQQGEELFARHVADILESAATGESTGEIVVIAAPQTLGELRGQYGRQTRAQLKCEIAKDLANHSSAAIIAAINAFEPA